MSAFGDAMKAVRDVVVMQTRIDALYKALEDQSREAKALAGIIIDVDKRLSRLEGMIEGAALARRSLPKE